MIKNVTADEISRSAVEITEIMKYAPLEVRLKYPNKFREYFRRVIDKDYDWKYDTSKKLYDQNISELTKNILVYLNETFFSKGNQ